jgi:3-phytase/alkaline phosphatase D
MAYTKAMVLAVLGVWFWSTAAFAQPDHTVRFATFNAALTRSGAGALADDLATPDDAQARAVAEIIQRVDPGVLLINEFDFDAVGAAAGNFQRNYLEVGQNDAAPIAFPYSFSAPVNTGLPSGHDLDNNGRIGGSGDAFGFGWFGGQYGMLLLSKYPIVTDQVRTFQNFLWKDMPGAMLPDDLETPAADDWYSPEELEVVRLSSKSHWDVPLRIEQEVVHVLASHPTPPVFDGPEDRNGKRNHDEIGFWSDYLTPGADGYIYDDAGARGGLPANARFVIMGDQNADPCDGDTADGAIWQLLAHPRVNATIVPASEGGVDAAARQGGANRQHVGNPAFDTGDFADAGADAAGNLRTDYVLPSVDLPIVGTGVFWPRSDDPLFRLVGNGAEISSDHRLVFVDLVVPEPAALRMFAAGALAWLALGCLRRTSRKTRQIQS